jgi:hypothetical protein
MASPVDEKYLQTLSGEMHGPFSPAIWLDLLPLGSINAAGKDTVGGFAADKYNVNGQVAGQSITGTILFEPLADALVQAELHVPVALLSDPGKPQQGELKIMLNAQKADIPLVSLPGASENKAGASPTLAPASSSSSSSKPTIANTYAVQTILPAAGGNKGGGPGSAMLVLPGQVWTGSMFSGLQQWDPQTGKVVKTYPEVTSKIFYDMNFDGKNLWVLTNDKFLDTFPDTLYVISLPEGDIVKKFEIKSNKLLTQIGSSPGKMWVASTIYDTETLLANPVSKGLPDEAHYAFNGEQWMWITGTNCHMCGHDLWLYDANNLPDHKDSQNSGTIDDGVLGSRMVLADGKIWLIVRPNGEPTYILDAYDIHKSDQPVLQVDLTKEFKDTGSQSSDVFITTDNHVGWLSMVGKLYYFDLKTGQMLGSLPIGEHIMGMGFDGQSLWVLSNDDGLIQVSLPW